MDHAMIEKVGIGQLHTAGHRASLRVACAEHETGNACMNHRTYAHHAGF